MKNFKQAKKYFLSYKRRHPLEPESYYFLGMILEKEEQYSRAAIFFKDALRLGLDDIEPLRHLIKIYRNLKENGDIIDFVTTRYRLFKRRFTRFKKLDLKKGNGLCRVEKKMITLGKWINTRR